MTSTCTWLVPEMSISLVCGSKRSSMAGSSSARRLSPLLTFSSSPRVLGVMAKEMAGGANSYLGNRTGWAGSHSVSPVLASFSLAKRHDVARRRLLDGLGLFALHQQDVAGALLLVRPHVQQAGCRSMILPGEDPGQVDSAGELIVDGLEDEERGRRPGIGLHARLFSARSSPSGPGGRPVQPARGMRSRASSSRSMPMFLVATTGRTGDTAPAARAAFRAAVISSVESS